MLKLELTERGYNPAKEHEDAKEIGDFSQIIPWMQTRVNVVPKTSLHKTVCYTTYDNISQLGHTRSR